MPDEPIQTVEAAAPPPVATPEIASQDRVIYIYYYDDIDPKRVNIIMGLVSQVIAQQKPTTLYFMFASRGGQVTAGVTLYNFLKSLPVKIVMHNIGAINSIANVIFLAGEERYASPHTTFLFHGVTSTLNGSLSLPQLNEIRDSIHKDHNTIAGIVCDNTKITDPEIKKLFEQGETKDVQFALEKGIIHEVKVAQVPQEGKFISININS